MLNKLLNQRIFVCLQPNAAEIGVNIQRDAFYVLCFVVVVAMIMMALFVTHIL